jgi:hypothetical protein
LLPSDAVDLRDNLVDIIAAQVPREAIDLVHRLAPTQAVTPNCRAS